MIFLGIPCKLITLLKNMCATYPSQRRLENGMHIAIWRPWKIISRVSLDVFETIHIKSFMDTLGVTQVLLFTKNLSAMRALVE